MDSLFRIVGIACLLFLTWFTGSKLVKMAKIRGFVAGPAPQAKIITNKAVLAGSSGDAYWIVWDGADIRTPGRNRVNLPKEVWDRFQLDDPIAVYYFPGEEWAYTREDIYASDENFIFDGVLLTGWIAGIAALGFLQLRHMRRIRSSLPPPLPRIA